MTTRARVLIADDHAVVREGLRHVLVANDEFEVVAEASTGSEAVQLATRHQPDVIVMDISMPDGTGFSALAQLREIMPHVKVLILSIHEHERYLLESVKAGADGYMTKDSSPAELREAVRALYRGERYVSAALAGRLAAAQQAAQNSGDAGKLSALTPREREVVRGIVRGLTNKEIAAELRISTRTVESHRESLMLKLGIRHVAALTRLVLEQGISEG